MVNLTNMPNELAVRQIGLYSDDPAEIKAFVDRVVKFNNNNATNIIVDLFDTPVGDAQFERPHVKIDIKFPSPEVQDKFWLE